VVADFTYSAQPSVMCSSVAWSRVMACAGWV
jgi:hypothetical protein